MIAILRKLGTAARMLASPGGVRKFVELSGTRWRQFKVKRHKGLPFRYTNRAGSRFVCIPASATSVYEYVSNGYQQIEIGVCREWVRAGDACLDIGANIGLTTSSLAACVGSEGLVVSVEPAPATHAVLRQGMQLLGHQNIRFESVCVTDRRDTVRFMVATGEGSDLEASMQIEASQLDRFTEITVPAVTIDSLLDKYPIKDRLALAKIDTEGVEPMALRGGARLFNRERLPLFVSEVNRVTLANFGFTPSDVLQFFPDELFELFHVPHSRSDLAPRFECGRIYALPDAMAHDWPIYSKLIAVPRAGHYACRRRAIANLLGTSA
jgi:FkbM family methyltransferase